jgi:hypothetical protein
MFQRFWQAEFAYSGWIFSEVFRFSSLKVQKPTYCMYNVVFWKSQ